MPRGTASVVMICHVIICIFVTDYVALLSFVMLIHYIGSTTCSPRGHIDVKYDDTTTSYIFPRGR